MLLCACATIKVLILARLAHVGAQQVQGGIPGFDVVVLEEIVDHLSHTHRKVTESTAGLRFGFEAATPVLSLDHHVSGPFILSVSYP